MQQFIPFEDDWALAEALSGHRLVPYQAGMRCGFAGEATQIVTQHVTRTEEPKLFAPPSQPSPLAL